MKPEIISVLLNIIVLIVLVIPVVRGYLNGFVKTVMRLLRFVLAFIFALLLAKPLGMFLKSTWLGERFYGIVKSAFGDAFSGAVDSEGLTEALPSGIKTLLEAFGFDSASAAEQAAQAGEEMIQKFVDMVSDRLASIASVALAFVLIIILSLILLKIFSGVLDFIVQKLPLIRGLNRLLGLGVGVLIGIVAAWTASQTIVFLLTTFTEFDYSQASVLKFFHDISPLRWILQLIAHTMVTIAA